MARAKGDWQAAIRADELIGKTLGCFTDVQVIDEPERRELSEREAEEVTQLAKIRLQQKYGLQERAHTPVSAEKKVG
jgi:hypothetical protein